MDLRISLLCEMLSDDKIMYIVDNEFVNRFEI